MRFISTSAHGIIDYLMGAFLIVSPWVFGFSDIDAATWTVIVIGAGAILYSLLTNYELGAFKTIPMTTHLWMDAVAGAVLALSPWLFGFAEYVFWPHLLLGLAEVMAALTTKTQPTYGHPQTSRN